MDTQSLALESISPNGLILFGGPAETGNRITSSLAIQVDSISIIVVAYKFQMTSFFVRFVSDRCSILSESAVALSI